MKKNMQYILKVLMFLGGFTAAFLLIQRIVSPKWYYPDKAAQSMSRVLTGYYEEEKESLEVLTFGSSHMLYGFSPMELYEKYGITSYNLATPSQSLPITYYILQEALKTQKPKLIILDAASLYYLNPNREINWRYLLESMPLSRNKIEFSYEFSKERSENSFISALVPLLRYHDRWKELDKQDYTDFFRNRNFYSKGYFITTRCISAFITMEKMNDIQKDMGQIGESLLYEYHNEVYTEKIEKSALYDIIVLDENVKWLLKILELCRKENIELLLTKIPVIYYPNKYRASWTQNKYFEIKELCNKYDINYYDILYDSDAELNWDVDSMDGGAHMNLLGAIEVTEYLCNYLIEHYELKSEYIPDWEKDLEIYKRVKDVALLELETDFITYMNKLMNEYQDKTIFIASQEDMTRYLGDDGREVLKKLGIKTDFFNAYGSSFLAVIENGTVIYEGLANRTISYSGETLNSNRNYFLESCARYATPTISVIYPIASIIIGSKEYAMNKRGINIVVYDDKRDIVLDSVCFNTWSENRDVYRNYTVVNEYLLEFESYLIEKEAR